MLAVSGITFVKKSTMASQLGATGRVAASVRRTAELAELPEQRVWKVRDTGNSNAECGVGS